MGNLIERNVRKERNQQKYAMDMVLWDTELGKNQGAKRTD
jgi:hypothetical protein